MPRLADLLWAAPRREPLVKDCAQLIEGHVASRRGLKGIGLKTSFAMLKSLRPDAMPRALNALLPLFADALDPLFQEYSRAKGAAEEAAKEKDFSRFLQRHAQRTAAALLSVTDKRVESSKNQALKKMYARMRSSAESEVLDVVPGLADVMGRHLA
jgi:hypothetical protein